MASTHQNVTKFAQIALLGNAACRPAAHRVVEDRGRPRGSCPKYPNWADRSARSSAAESRPRRRYGSPELMCTGSTTAGLAGPPELAGSVTKSW
jgi:hypothetical protein